MLWDRTIQPQPSPKGALVLLYNFKANALIEYLSDDIRRLIRPMRQAERTQIAEIQAHYAPVLDRHQRACHDAYLRTLDYDDDPEGERFESDPNYLEDGIPCPGGY